ncbi:hypothetical protein BCR34DRAFT_277261 [Clohesyomyces aquaticus]|uniref:Uncharacterized protein n=1 Tax=Clohesyomyces aquaticus TaxID=1231657 RepID=A0A1Y1ZRX0_9PLEO|nr:hypothetical protein BCR34DRAFT_277261 [Clohesyomyces aquaticus]
MVEGKVRHAIDTVLLPRSRSSQNSYLSVLQQINELRLICNLGIHRKSGHSSVSLQAQSETWDSTTAQRAFEALVTAGNLQCLRCCMNLDLVEIDDLLGSDLFKSRHNPLLYRCLRIMCAACSQNTSDLSCGCHPLCPRASVSHTLSRSLSNASSPSDSENDWEPLPLPTKVKALVSDLKSLSTATKSVVFSYWTSTLDLIERGLRQASISFTRYDGNTSSYNRSLALRNFRRDPSKSVILNDNILCLCWSRHHRSLKSLHHRAAMEPSRGRTSLGTSTSHGADEGSHYCKIGDARLL